MPSIPKTLEIAIENHRVGRLRQAEGGYREILAQNPNHVLALDLLSQLEYQFGRPDSAAELIARAIQIEPGNPNFHANLGVFLIGAGKSNDAIAALRRAIALRADFPQALNNLGNALLAEKQTDQAVDALRQAIALAPDYVQAYSNLGNALKENGQLDEAIAAYRQAISLRPDYGQLHYNLANALKEQNRFEPAISEYQKSIELNPDFADAPNNLGNALRAVGRMEEAIAAYRRAIAVRGDFAEAYANLGETLRQMGRRDDAMEALNRALEIDPNSALVLNNLGTVLREKGQLIEAASSLTKSLAVQPDQAEALTNLANVLKDQGLIDQAIENYRKALVHQHRADVGDNLIFSLQYDPKSDAALLWGEHQRWAEEYAAPLAREILPHLNNRDPGRRLRIGFVSPDFRSHPVGFFLEGPLACLDPASVEIFCYADLPRSDATTARLQKAAAQWRDVTHQPDERVAAQIREDQIDILIDLAGHTAGNRLLIFARKPAPIQITYLGYPNTTGLKTIDYRITDAFADPPGLTERFHSEQLLRLPETFLCYAPADSITPTPPAPMPALSAGHVTFGSFNALPKINADVVALWSQALLNTPRSRMVIKCHGSDDPAVRKRLLDWFAGSGVTEDRVALLSATPSHAEHLRLYNTIDLALDTFPYHGTTTTCEAMLMGVPVVSLAGNRHLSRVGVSILSNAGQAELIGENPGRYVQIAVDLANDLPRLAALRSTLVDRVRSSPLMDPARFARNLEGALRTVWRRWAQGQGD